MKKKHSKRPEKEKVKINNTQNHKPKVKLKTKVRVGFRKQWIALNKFLQIQIRILMCMCDHY